MRIGIGASLLSYPRAQKGGLGSYMRNLLAALPEAANGHQLTVYWGREGHELAPRLGLAGRGLRHHYSRLPLRRRPLRLPYEQLALPLAAREDRVRVFHFLDHVSSLIPPAPRVVVTIHDIMTLLFPETFGKYRAAYKTLMTRVSVLAAARVIAISEATKRDLVEKMGVRPEKIRVVHYGLNPSFKPVCDPAAKAAAREKYGLPERFLIYVGTLEPRKNTERIIESYAIARQRYGITAPLVLAGQKGWLYERTLVLPTELGIEGQVRLTGYVDPADLPALYSQCEAFVFPTLYEGFGLPPLEAMACGAPVVASNVSAMPEVIQEAGLLVNPYDCDAIAAAIHRVTTDQPLRARLAEAGLRRARAFSWQRAARETVAVYEETAGC